MRTRTLFVAVAIALLAGALPAQAISVTMTEMVNGALVDVELAISGLGDGSSRSLGAWDIDLSYDPTTLAVLGTDFSSQLGDPALFEVIEGEAVGGGVVDAFQISLLPPAVLNAGQDPSFVFYTVSFGRLTGDATTIALTQLVLADELGNRIVVDPVAPVELPAGDPEVIIPEPGAALLFGVGLVVLERGRRQRGARARRR